MSIEVELDCYLCGGRHLEVIRNKLRNDVDRKVLQCADCGINYLEPQPKDLTEYYREEYRRVYTPVVGEQLDSRKTFEMYLPFQRRRMEPINDKLNSNMRVLELGCSAGYFLYTLKPHVKECLGIELNQENARFVNNELGIRTYTQPIEQTPIPEGYFDLVSAFHVVEHVEDPIALLSTLRRYLKPEGWLYVEVPNVNDALLSLYRSEPYAGFWYREPHIFNFSPDTLCKVVGRAGFRGDTSTTQRYNFVNHLNWTMTGKPQKSAEVGMGVPALAEEYATDPGLVQDLKEWAGKADAEYRKILNRHLLGDTIVFVGQKSSPSD